ncbi:MAG: type II secretion system protein J [Pyrinomonadaceae bacterium]
MKSMLTEDNTEKITAEKGFTIMELIVAMTIFMIVTGSIWGLLKVAGDSRGVVNQQIPLQKNVRLALSVMGRDTYNAGFGYPLSATVVQLPDNRIATLLGIPVDYDTAIDRVPPIMAGNNVNSNTYNTTTGTMTDQVTFLFKDSTFNPVPTPPNAAGVSTSLDINAITSPTPGIIEIAPTSGSNSVCRVNDIYLIVGTNAAALGLSTALNGTTGVRFANGDLLGFNQTGSTGGLSSITGNRSMMRVKMITYFVTSGGTLTRREFANVMPAVAFLDEPLVYNVDNFQIKYIMDNGTLSDNPSAGPDNIPGNADDVQANLAAVRQVRFTVSVRSTDLNSNRQPYRETMTSTFSTRNLGYEEN